MKWFKRTLIGLVVLAVLAVGVGFLLPSSYTVERSVVIDAEPARVHALVDDLRRWPEWEPWRESDPSIVVTLGTATQGVGAHQSWTGSMGGGELTFTASSPERGVEYDMSFDEGKWRSVAAVRYEPEGGGTRVVWTMSGDMGMNPLDRYFALLMDAMTGPMFERGLEKLKAAAESGGS